MPRGHAVGTGRATCGHPERRYAARGLCWTCYKREYRKTPKGRAQLRRIRSRNRKRHAAKFNERRWRKLGIACTSAQYIEMLAAQGGVCAICEKTTHRALHVDHDHATGRVRGLLCGSCNIRLAFVDNHGPGIARYLGGWPMTPPEIKNNQPEIKGRGGRRPGAGRPRKGVVEARCAGCAVLEAEVAHLKRELSAARKLPAVASIDGLVHAVGFECIHGGVYGSCRKIGCQPK